MLIYRTKGGNIRIPAIIRCCALSFVVSLFIFGCQSVGSIIGGKYVLSAPYRMELDRWTKRADIYQNFGLAISLAATYQSRSFRIAYVNEYAEKYDLKEAERKKKIAQQVEAAEAVHEFLVAAHMPIGKENDIGGKNPIWKVFLEVDSNTRLEPDEIIKQTDNTTATNYFFPYITPWKSIYRIRFYKPASGNEKTTTETTTNRIRLVVTGIHGRAVLSWDINSSENG